MMQRATKTEKGAARPTFRQKESRLGARSFAASEEKSQDQSCGPLCSVNLMDLPLHAKPSPNRTGMSNQLKAGIESLSGMDLSDLRVHHEADVMSAKALQRKETQDSQAMGFASWRSPLQVVQREIKNRVDGEHKWKTDHSFDPFKRNELTPYGALVEHYGSDKLDLNKLNKSLRSNEVRADIPGRARTTKIGDSSASASREGGDMEKLVKHLGDGEKWLKGRGGEYPYAGGHLIAYNILQEDSNVSANIAPQASQLNSPVYFNLFEKIGMNTTQNVNIDVSVAYRSPVYTIPSKLLIAKKILNESEKDKVPVTIPSRIPFQWRATVETLSEEGLSVRGSKTDGMKGLVTTDAAKYEENEVKRGMMTGYKVHVSEGGKEKETGLRTKRKAKKVSLTAEQQDFPSNPPIAAPMETEAPESSEDEPKPKIAKV